MLTPLQKAVSEQSDEFIANAISTYMGRKMLALSLPTNNGSVEDRISQVQAIRDNPVVQALPEPYRTKVLALCEDCIELVNE